MNGGERIAMKVSIIGEGVLVGAIGGDGVVRAGWVMMMPPAPTPGKALKVGPQ